MAITTQKNKLCLQDFTDWAGIHPLLFNSIDVCQCTNFQIASDCEEWWFQWKTPHNDFARETMAQILFKAEGYIATYTKVFPTPCWVTKEDIELPMHYDRRKWYLNRRIESMRFNTKYGRVTNVGLESHQFVQDAPVVYNDNDSDSFFETATVTVILTGTWSEEQVKGMNLYHQGYNGDKKARICPHRFKSYDENTQEAVWEIDTWLLVRPELYITRTFLDERAINGCDLSNFVTDIDIYFNGPDTCSPHGFIYSRPFDCPEGCESTKTPICMRILDECTGLFEICPVELDENGCISKVKDCFDYCELPYKIEINYEAGCTDEADCLVLREAVYKLAVSSFPYRWCDCFCIDSDIKMWQEETSLVIPNKPRWNYPAKVRSLSPWGTRLGALEAYMAIDDWLGQSCC